MKIVKYSIWAIILFLLLYMFRLQIVLPVIYFSIGFLLYVFIILWAKAKNMDAQMEEWRFTLTTVEGLVKFVLTGTIIWGFIAFSLIKENVLKNEEKSLFSILDYLKSPGEWHRYWFKKYYQ